VEPAITDITLPAKLSGPSDSKTERSSAVLPLPDMGRSKAAGTISAGKPSFSATGEIKSESRSVAVEALSIVTAVMRAIIVGAMRKRVYSPSFAPSRNASKILTFFISPTDTKVTIMRGIIISNFCYPICFCFCGIGDLRGEALCFLIQKIFATVIPTISAAAEVIHTDGRIEKGSVLPYLER